MNSLQQSAYSMIGEMREIVITSSAQPSHNLIKTIMQEMRLIRKYRLFKSEQDELLNQLSNPNFRLIPFCIINYFNTKIYLPELFKLIQIRERGSATS